jgi:uncharacterized membrane protein
MRALRGSVIAWLAVLIFGGLHTSLAQTFQHPGVLLSKAQLDYMKIMVNAHVEPFYSTFLKVQSNSYGSLTYVPFGPPSDGFIKCGSSSNPDIGCSNSDSDAAAAYTQALLWYITGNQTYAQNAITILNLYGHNLKGYLTQSPYTNAPLQAAWDGEKWPRAAEIIRYSNAGWQDSDIQAFQTMLDTAIVPLIQNGSTDNGNWEISMNEALMGIGVFNEEPALFNKGVSFWRQRTPAYFYYHTDGSQPVPAPRGNPGWNGQTVFNPSVDGVSQESCRDFGHAQYGIAGTLNAAETARIQGTDLFSEQTNRLTAALEFNSYYLSGNPVPTAVCGGTVTLVIYPTDEVGYNAYHNRLGIGLPYTLSYLTNTIRLLHNPVDAHMMVYESLTHGGDASSQQPFLLWTSSNTPIIRSGNNATYTVTVVPGSDPNPAVSFSVTGLPSGATYSFSPSPVTGSGTSTLTVTTSSTTPSGNYTLIITGASATSTYSNIANLTVNSASADFSIAASPVLASVVGGDVATYTTTFTPIGGYAGGVNLSVTGGLPAGATAAFSSSTVSSTNPTSTLTVLTAGTTAPGAYSLTISASDNVTTHTTTALLVVNAIGNACIQQLGNNWISGTVPVQTGTFTAEWDSTPSTTTNNTNIGLSLGAQTAFTGLAVAVRFNTTGTIDARNAGAFTADNNIPYAAGTAYHFRAVVNVPANTYSMFVTPAGQAEITVGSNYAFRTEQAGITSIDHWDAISQAGTISLCNLVVDTPDFSVTATPSSQAVAAGGSTNYTTTITPISSYADSVTLAASGLPSGATATFSPSTVTSSSYSSTLNVATMASVPVGIYPFTITASDGTLTHTAYLGLAVNVPCQTPVATAQSVTATANGVANIALAGGLGPGCASTDTLKYVVTTNPSHGALSGTPPALIYTPTAGYSGPDTFSFTVADSNAIPPTSSAAAVSISVVAPISTVPVIGSLSPAVVVAGSPAITLKLQGSNFLSTSTVLWNGASRTTSYVSASQLTVAVPVSDLATAGTANVTVSNTGTGSGISSPMKFAIDTGAAISLTTQNPSITVIHGQSVAVPLQISNVPSNAPTATVCYDLPVAANCSYNSTTRTITVTTGASTPAGTYQVLLVCNTNPSQSASLSRNGLPMWCGLLGLPLGLLTIFGGKRRRIYLGGLLGVLLVCAIGCSSSSSSSTTTQPAVAAQVSAAVTLTVN